MKQFLPLVACILYITSTSAQSTQLAPDQNPNYMASQQKYMQYKDSLQSTMNSTVQQTYKAYDWYEAKLERKQSRIENRNQRRLYRSYANADYYYGYNNSYNGYYGNNNFYNRYRLPYTGYRSGNWWFWF